ncbi:SGNH/GDSL hydrolase family protein [Actinocorallia sp. B10E7]|uniref:SGNH/GDSL hydrolase family protein n=1 Tax=Actinocorallia sp. B10E7 TaxID=3153558 RepID=UPI00325D938B
MRDGFPFKSTACATAAACLLLGSQVPAGAKAGTPLRYVALGDSYTSAPYVSRIRPGSPLTCRRSALNYPGRIARKLRPRSFTDMSCSGASLRHLTAPQGANPPQLSALRPNTTLVTLTLAGNDIGFDRWKTCALVSLIDSEGAPCRRKLRREEGGDPFARAVARTGPRFGAALRRIRERSPLAEVYVLGYPRLVPPTGGGCYPRVPLARGDVGMVRNAQRRLNAMLAYQARVNGAVFVDMSRPGHDMCQRDDRKRWIEPFFPARRGAPLHPNARGAAAMARAVLRAMWFSADV